MGSSLWGGMSQRVGLSIIPMTTGRVATVRWGKRVTVQRKGLGRGFHPKYRQRCGLSITVWTTRAAS